MPFRDLRDFIRALQEMGEIKVIEGASCDVEIGAVTEIATGVEKRPALLFDSIAGFAKGYRVLTNIISNGIRERLVFGVPRELINKEAAKFWKERLKTCKSVAPREVSAAPVKENVLRGRDVDLSRIPFPKWHERDGGPYMCGTLILARDPDSKEIQGSSCAFKLVDPQTLAPHIRSRNGDAVWKKYWERGKACPVAISLGHDPALFVAAGAHLPWTSSVYGFAGWLRGEPVDVIRGEQADLPIPATAEVVLEGEVLPPIPGEKSEGPFGEFCGYYLEGSRPAPSVKIKGMLFRNDPIVLGNPPFVGGSYGVLSSKAALIWNELEELGIPNITGINHLPWGLTIISIKQAYPGHVMRVAHGALGTTAGHNARFIIIIDDDIDPFNLEKVFWAIATRYEPQQALDISRRISSDKMYPCIPKERKKVRDYAGSVALIDACKPYHWMDKFPRTTDISEELLKQTAEKWERVLRPHG